VTLSAHENFNDNDFAAAIEYSSFQKPQGVVQALPKVAAKVPGRRVATVRW